MAEVWAVMPVKRLWHAKQRLAPLLAPIQRQILMRAMAEDVADAIAASRGLSGIIIVAGDDFGAALGCRLGAELLRDARGCGQGAAVAMAARHLAGRRDAILLALPADMPLVHPTEIEAVVAAHPLGAAMTIVASRDGDGSNAIAVSPPGALRFHFGSGSHDRHCAEADRVGLQLRELSLPGIGLDIDTPSDLMELLRCPGSGRTAQFLRACGVGQRREFARRAESRTSEARQ